MRISLCSLYTVYIVRKFRLNCLYFKEHSAVHQLTHDWWPNWGFWNRD